MNLADRIHQLRKEKGISQEELADQLGVSRQAVSKWESEQSNPDIDKILIMSEFFDVTTDYILKGIEPISEVKGSKVDSTVFAVVGSALNLIGLAVSCAVWYERQIATALVIGLVFMALGCMVFFVGTQGSALSTKNKAKRMFWSVNVWLISFMPLSILYNVIFAGLIGPYPIPMHPIIGIMVWMVIYVVLCLSVMFMIRNRYQ